LGLQVPARLVGLELGAAEPQGRPGGAEGDWLHAEHADVEVDGLVEVGDGEDQVVDPVDDDRRAWRCWGAHAATVPTSTGWRMVACWPEVPGRCQSSAREV